MDELREAFEKAYDENSEQVEAIEPVENVETPEGELNVETQDDHEKDEPEPTPNKNDERKKPEKNVNPAVGGAPLQDGTTKKPIKAVKAPASWTPKARETWGKLPIEAQAEIAKRETEINSALQQSAQARNALSALNEILAPHREMLMANGVNDPLRHIGTLVNTEAALRRGDHVTKAQTVASLIRNYGVDIETLDSILAGQAPQAPKHNDIEQLINQRLAPLDQFIQQQQMASQQAEYYQQQKANQSVEEFGQNAEFLDDVRLDMADLLEMASSRGRVLSLQDAYDKACALHPEIGKIIEQRKRDQQIMGTRNEIAQKRNAASSIRGTKGGIGGGGKGESLRSQIEDAWSQLG